MPSVIERIKAHPAVESVSDERNEDGGFWVYLKSGFKAIGSDPAGLSVIHEDTPAKCLPGLKHIVRVARLIPTEGGHQKPKDAFVLSETATGYSVRADGEQHVRRFRKSDMLHASPAGRREFPNYRLEIV